MREDLERLYKTPFAFVKRERVSLYFPSFLFAYSVFVARRKEPPKYHSSPPSSTTQTEKKHFKTKISSTPLPHLYTQVVQRQYAISPIFLSNDDSLTLSLRRPSHLSTHISSP
jgi:hypothetical protein